MRLEQQYNRLLELKKTINIKLSNMDFNGRKELLLWLAGHEDYAKLKRKDNQLLFLSFFSNIWLEEIKKNSEFQMQGDALFGVSSLDDVERKYHAGKFLALRIENDIPKEFILDGVNEILGWQYSGFALHTMISAETKERDENIIKLSRVLMDVNQAVKAIGLLERENEIYPGNDKVILELANCWLEVQQLEKAYKCLCLIANRTEQINEMIIELEMLIKDDNV